MLHIVIAGAGIAGLAAAVSLRRAGHHVRLYEQSSLNNEVGAAITIPPNASRILLAWGVRPQDWGFVLAEGASGYDPFTMEKTMDFGSKGSAEAIGGAPMYLSHRVDLHNCLQWLATREQGPGVPAKIHRQSNVAAFDPEAPSITLRNGEVIHADLIVGADGVHSRAAEAVLQHKVEAIAPQHSNICYRFLIPASVLEEDPETRHWNIANRSRIRVFSHNDTQRRLVTYVCRDNTVHNFVGLIYDESARLDAEGMYADNLKNPSAALTARRLAGISQSRRNCRQVQRLSPRYCQGHTVSHSSRYVLGTPLLTCSLQKSKGRQTMAATLSISVENMA